MRLLIAIVAAMAMAASAPPTKPGKSASTQPGMRDAELARRLLGEGGASRDSLRTMLSLMDEAGDRLEDRSDSSPDTQRVQARALRALDDAIADARKNLSQSRSSRKPQKGESRTAGRRSETRSEPDPGKPRQPDGAAQAGTGPGSGPARGSSLTERPELRRGWGFLPQRDREAIVQGYAEQYHAKYREYIEQYYRAIAEKAEAEK